MMRIHGPLPTRLPLAPKWRNPKPNSINDGQEQPSSANTAGVARFEAEVEYIAAGETFNFEVRELSAAARRALKGYWAVTQQGQFKWQRIDIYV